MIDMSGFIDKDEVNRKYFVSGKTYQEIADELDISRQRVHQIVTGYRSPPPDNHEYARPVKLKRFLKRWNEKNPNIIPSGTSKYLSYKIITLMHYGLGKLACVKCGFGDIRALSIDHVKGDGCEHRKQSSGSLYTFLIKNHLPKGYQTLCMNCQFIKRYTNGEMSHNKYFLSKPPRS